MFRCDTVMVVACDAAPKGGNIMGVGLGSPRFSPKRSLARAADQDDCTLVTKGTLLYQINGEPPIFTAGHAFWTWYSPAPCFWPAAYAYQCQCLLARRSRSM